LQVIDPIVVNVSAHEVAQAATVYDLWICVFGLLGLGASYALATTLGVAGKTYVTVPSVIVLASSIVGLAACANVRMDIITDGYRCVAVDKYGKYAAGCNQVSGVELGEGQDPDGSRSRRKSAKIVAPAAGK
jgi:hypothetical protein